MSRIYVPSRSCDDWRCLLADPETQWRVGYSARTLATCWEREPSNFPPEIRRALRDVPELQDMELVAAFPEHRVPLPGGERPSQTDVFALGGVSEGLVSIAIEGKVSESFGELVSDWQRDASDGKHARLGYICQVLGISVEDVPQLRYQLLHRAASALLEARRFRASTAMMLVHSFSSVDAGFEDYWAFGRALGIDPTPGGVIRAGNRHGVSFFIGWIRGDARYLTTQEGR